MANKLSKMQKRLQSAPNRRSFFAIPHSVPTPTLVEEEKQEIAETGSAHKRVIFMGRPVAQNYSYEPDDVVISICDCSAQTPVFAREPKDVLPLKFQDYVTTYESEKLGYHWMMADDGDKIAQFVQKHTASKTIIVHCNYGQSRSKAIAIAIAEYTGRKLLHSDDFGRIIRYRNLESDRGNNRCGDIVRMGFECLEEETQQ